MGLGENLNVDLKVAALKLKAQGTAEYWGLVSRRHNQEQVSAGRDLYAFR